MDGSTDPGRWSAVPVAAEPVDLPWGLTVSALRRVAPELGTEVIISREHRIRGLHQQDASQILTVRHRDGAGHQRSRILFLKRTDHDTREAEKYRYLAARAAPVAPLLGVIDTDAGPVIITEFLPRIGTRPDEVDDLLELTARINAITDTPETLFRAAAGDPRYDRRIHAAVVTLRSRSGDAFAPDPDRWLDAYHRAARAAANSPRALNHNELAPQQIGWTSTGPDARLVVVDLATMARLPRFSDVAGLLAPLSEQTGRTESDLIDSYLERLSGHLGTTVSGSAVHREVITVRLVRAFEALPWWLGPESPVVETPERICLRMSADLTHLGLLTAP